MTGFTNLSQFQLDISTWAKTHLVAQIKLAIQKLAMDILRDVVANTPVDTGRARGNWQVSFNQSPEIALLVSDKEGNKTVQTGIAKLEEIMGQPLGVVYLTNNISYIQYLEEGTSKRGGKHMLHDAVEKARAQFG